MQRDCISCDYGPYIKCTRRDLAITETHGHPMFTDASSSSSFQILNLAYSQGIIQSYFVRQTTGATQLQITTDNLLGRHTTMNVRWRETQCEAREQR